MEARRKPSQSAKTEWLKIILMQEPREIAVEAAYFAVRELKQLSIPPEQRKEHFEDARESVPTTKTRALASRIMHEIETHEGLKKDDLSKHQAEFYLHLMLATVRKLETRVFHVKKNLGKQLLDQLRAEG